MWSTLARILVTSASAIDATLVSSDEPTIDEAAQLEESLRAVCASLYQLSLATLTAQGGTLDEQALTDRLELAIHLAAASGNELPPFPDLSHTV
jgi:hypothetical protein